LEILKDRYSITELSEKLEITAHALRYYEKEFKLHVPKDERGRRFYTTDLANIMYQIKSMRSEGLEIKAIKKILLSEEIISEPPPVIQDESTLSMIPIVSENKNPKDLMVYFDDFKEQIISCVSSEVSSAKEVISREINKSKLELGACVENSARKIESKMERHFSEVDRMLGIWREKNKKGIFRKLF
jgi:DNA-binding transcriptional MerR regulator